MRYFTISAIAAAKSCELQASRYKTDIACSRAAPSRAKFFRTRRGLSMISPAFAQTSGAGGTDIVGLLFPLVLVFGIFYLLVFRPQQKKMKEHQSMIDAVKRGDTVVTSGGIIGKVIRVGADGELRVEIADNVQVRIVKGSITDVRGKGEPVKEKAKAEAPSGGGGDGTQPGA
jgi:preprotein translocase subunit YajC